MRTMTLNRSNTIRVDSHEARDDKIFFRGFHMLEFTLVRRRQLTTESVSLGLREENILPVC
jgi:hypothetical protein